MSGANFAQRGAVGPEPIRHDHFGAAVLAHCFLEELKRSPLVAGLRHEALEDLSLVINGSPEVVSLAVDLHEHLVEMPSPLARPHTLDPTFPDLGCEHRAEAMPPEPDRLVADVDPTFVQQVFDIPKRQREADIHHHGKTDNLARRLEVLEWARSGHWKTLQRPLPRLKPGLSDKTRG